MSKSLNRSIYLVIGVDDATRTIFSETFRSKDVVHKKIQDIISFINNSRSAHIVKTVHFDNGREFLGAEICEWLIERGIKHTTSAAHTLKHNGVAEHAIQTIVSMARCLLIASGLLQQFWAEAVRMAVIIYNMVSETANNHQPPQLL
jgi:transposase InsO family protein